MAEIRFTATAQDSIKNEAVRIELLRFFAEPPDCIRRSKAFSLYKKPASVFGTNAGFLRLLPIILRDFSLFFRKNTEKIEKFKK